MHREQQQETHHTPRQRLYPFDSLVVTEHCGLIGIFATHTQAEAAMHRLKKSNFDMRQISIVGRDYHSEENIAGYGVIGDRKKFWGQLGSFWSDLSSMLYGTAYFVIPNVGLIVVAGSFISALIAAFEGAGFVGGLNALDAALFSEGLPKSSILKFETAIRDGKFLLIVHGTTQDVALARDILHLSGAQNTTDLHLRDCLDNKESTKH
jgi:hypothetical protein